MRILVTGGAGFIGTHLVRQHAERRAGSITVFDNLHRGRFGPLAALGGAVRLLQADVRDPGALETAVCGADLVYHLAAQSSVMNSATDPEYAFHSNVTGTYQLLRLAREHGVRRVVFTSSREVYGDPARLPVPESAPLAPKNAYGASKAAGEMYCRAFASDGMGAVILRLANVYGPGDCDRVIPIFVENALMGEPLVLYGGQQLMDFVWIDAVVDALIAAGLSPCPAGPLNVGSGRGVTVAELAKRVVAAAGSRSPVRVAQSRDIEVSRFVADVTLARRFFHLEPPADPLFGLPAVVSSTVGGQAVSPARPHWTAGLVSN